MNGITQEIFNLLVDQGVFHTLCQKLMCNNGGQCISHVLTDGKHQQVPEFCFCKEKYYGRHCEYEASTKTAESPQSLSLLKMSILTIVLIMFFSAVSFALGRKTKGAQIKKTLKITRNSSSLKTHSRQGSFQIHSRSHSRNNSRNIESAVIIPVPSLIKAASSNRHLEVPNSESLKFDSFQ